MLPTMMTGDDNVGLIVDYDNEVQTKPLRSVTHRPSREVLRPEHNPNEGAVPVLGGLMSDPPLPPPKFHRHKPSLLRSLDSQPLPLYKQKSWSPDAYRDEAWLRRRRNCLNKRSKSVTDDDLDELKACIELGFGFDSPEVDQRLSDTLPALELYYAVNKHYTDSVSKPSTILTELSSSSSTASDCDTPSTLGSPHTIIGPDDNPQTVKTRLRQWAQLVACSVRQFSSS